MPDNTKVTTVIDKNAIIPVELGAGYVDLLIKAWMFLMNERTQEELEAFNQAVESENIPQEGWMPHYFSIYGLIIHIQQTAIDKGLTKEVPIASEDSQIQQSADRPE